MHYFIDTVTWKTIINTTYRSSMQKNHSLCIKYFYHLLSYDFSDFFCLLPPIVKTQFNFCTNQVNYLTTEVLAILCHTSLPFPLCLPFHTQEKLENISFSLDQNLNLHFPEMYAFWENVQTQGGEGGNIQSGVYGHKSPTVDSSLSDDEESRENLPRLLLDLKISLKKFFMCCGDFSLK